MHYRRIATVLIAVSSFFAGSRCHLTQAADKPIRVLFVGGDWKAQLPNFQGKTPLRGFFVREQVQKAAPHQFEFTLWTSYEFLQYGEADSLKKFDVIVAGDIMGQSVLPRLVRGLESFVENGGGFLYCDNHKAFSFNTMELSFDSVLPIEVVPFRPYDPPNNQPLCTDKPLKVSPAAADHAIMKGLKWADAPPLGAARYGKLKTGATVLARSPSGKEIWVAQQRGKGRVVWLGGVFSNDELSEEFSKWPQFGQFYAQVLAWLAEHAEHSGSKLASATAAGTLTVNLAQAGPTLTSAHFGIHGQEDASGGSQPMTGVDLALYKELRLEGTFARTGAGSPGDYVQRGPKGQYDYLDDGADLAAFDKSKYDFARTDGILADIDRIGARPIMLAWCPWWGPEWPQPARYTKYFAAVIEHANGQPGSAEYRPRVNYFEVMNEPDLKPVGETLPRYTDFFNHTAEKLHPRYPGIKLGCGGFFEWSYIQQVMDNCGKNLDWVSRHPYGHTGEAVFYLQDRYEEHARSKGLTGLEYLITEWDFWIYGEPAFDYIMQRWKPLADHAEKCRATLHYRWREYAEGGYVFGIHGEFDQRYGELPPEWPNPGKDKPITYRYNAFWLMRNCRGPQFETALKIDEFKASQSTRAYAIATTSGKRFNIVVYYGYPLEDLAAGKSYGKVKIRLKTAIPKEVKGRSLVIARGDCRRIAEEPAKQINGDELDLDLEIPAQSGVSLTVE